MLLFASYHYSERTRVTDWWRKTPDKSFLSTSVFVAFLLSYSLTLRQLRSYSLTWGSCSYSVTSNNRKRLLKIAQCEPGLRGRSHSTLLSPFFQSARAVALRRRLSLLSNHQLRSPLHLRHSEKLRCFYLDAARTRLEKTSASHRDRVASIMSAHTARLHLK